MDNNSNLNENALVPVVTNKNQINIGYYWSTYVHHPISYVGTKLVESVGIVSKISNIIAYPFNSVSKLFTKLPDVDLNVDVKANLSIKSKKDANLDEKSQRVQRIRQLEEEISKIYKKMSDFEK